MNQPAKVMRWRALVEASTPLGRGAGRRPRGRRMTGAAFLLLALALVVAAGDWFAVLP